MSKKYNTGWLIALAVILGIATGGLAVAFYYARKKNEEKDKEIHDLQNDKLRLIRETINNTKSLPNEAKIQLAKMSGKFEGIDDVLADELMSVIRLADSGENAKSVAALANAMEHLTKKKFSTDSSFKDWLKTAKKKSSAVLADFLEYAKETKVINDTEHSLATSIRQVRNKAVHEAGHSITDNWANLHLLAGVDLIAKLSIADKGKVVQIAKASQTHIN